MAALKKIDMMEATRLTREGRLQEAMELLLGASVRSSGFHANAQERALDEVSLPTTKFLQPQTGHDSARKFNVQHIPNVEADDLKPQISRTIERAARSDEKIRFRNWLGRVDATRRAVADPGTGWRAV